MKLKLIVLWVFGLGLLAAVGGLYMSNQRQAAELAELRAQSQELQHARDELEELKTTGLPSHNAELARLRKDNEDLLRLRREVRELREEKEQVLKQVQSAQAAADQAQQQLQSQTQATKQIFQASACIHNLRRLDAAKQQWASEKQQTAEAVPAPQDLLPYLGNAMPVCPSGGQYTLNALNQEPACSTPGHALPK